MIKYWHLEIIKTVEITLNQLHLSELIFLNHVWQKSHSCSEPLLSIEINGARNLAQVQLPDFPGKLQEVGALLLHSNQSIRFIQ